MEKLFEGLLDTLREKGVIDINESNKMKTEFTTKLEEQKEKMMEIALKVVDADHSQKLEEILEHIDSEHSTKLEEVLEHVDNDHSEKLQHIIESMDEDHTSKLNVLAECIVTSKDEKLIGNVSSYLDTYLEEVSPKETLVNEAKMQRYESMFDTFKQQLAINEDYVQDEVKEAIYDAKQQMDSLTEKVDKLMVEKVTLKSEIKDMKRNDLLSEKVEDLSPKMQSYIKTYFKESNAVEINENFDSAISSFKENEKSERVALMEKNKNRGVHTKQIVTEGLAQQVGEKSTSIMEGYVNTFKKSVRR